MILSRNMTLSRCSGGASFEHRRTALSRSRLNVSMVRLDVAPTAMKLGTAKLFIIISISFSLVKNHVVPNSLPLLVTRQKTVTFVSFSLLASMTVPPFSTGGIVESPVTNCEQ